MTKNTIKFSIAKHFNLSEADIDESLIPLFTSLIESEKLISSKLEASQHKINDSLSQHLRSNEQLIQQIRGSITTHNYAGASPKTAFWTRWGWGFWVVLLLIITPPVTWFYNEYVTKGLKYKHLEKVIIYDTKSKEYYISTENYRKSNHRHIRGIVINL